MSDRIGLLLTDSLWRKRHATEVLAKYEKNGTPWALNEIDQAYYASRSKDNAHQLIEWLWAYAYSVGVKDRD